VGTGLGLVPKSGIRLLIKRANFSGSFWGGGSRNNLFNIVNLDCYENQKNTIPSKKIAIFYYRTETQNNFESSFSDLSSMLVVRFCPLPLNLDRSYLLLIL
jgi:hypothetical protein